MKCARNEATPPSYYSSDLPSPGVAIPRNNGWFSQLRTYNSFTAPPPRGKDYWESSAQANIFLISFNCQFRSNAYNSGRLGMFIFYCAEEQSTLQYGNRMIARVGILLVLERPRRWLTSANLNANFLIKWFERPLQEQSHFKPFIFLIKWFERPQ